jgi:hypothetical protein
MARGAAIGVNEDGQQVFAASVPTNHPCSPKRHDEQFGVQGTGDQAGTHNLNAHPFPPQGVVLKSTADRFHLWQLWHRRLGLGAEG